LSHNRGQKKYSLLSYHYITADKTQTQYHLQTWLCDKTITNYIISYLIMWQENYALYLYYLTDFVCLYNYKFLLSLCKIARSSVILLLPLPDYVTRQLRTIFFLSDYVTRQLRTIVFLPDYVTSQLQTIIHSVDLVNEVKVKWNSHCWQEWESDYCLMSNEELFSHIMARTMYIRWDDNDIHFVLDHHT
jgi:hypothetical protein